jgi:hypothetical protein
VRFVIGDQDGSNLCHVVDVEYLFEESCNTLCEQVHPLVFCCSCGCHGEFDNGPDGVESCKVGYVMACFLHPVIAKYSKEHISVVVHLLQVASALAGVILGDG